MKKLAVPVFLVLCAYALSWCFVGGSGGKTTARFYCTEPGCALNVTTVFCNDKSVPFNRAIEECTGPPPPNTVCQHHGLAFVSTDTSGTCEFEGGTHFETKRCTDNTDVCDFTSDVTPSPLTIPQSRNQNQRGPGSHYILVVSVTGVVLALLVGVVLYWRKNKESNQQPQSNTPVRLTACLWTMGGSRALGRNPRGEQNMQTPHRGAGV